VAEARATVTLDVLGSCEAEWMRMLATSRMIWSLSTMGQSAAAGAVVEVAGVAAAGAASGKSKLDEVAATGSAGTSSKPNAKRCKRPAAAGSDEDSF